MSSPLIQNKPARNWIPGGAPRVNNNAPRGLIQSVVFSNPAYPEVFLGTPVSKIGSAIRPTTSQVGPAIQCDGTANSVISYSSYNASPTTTQVASVEAWITTGPSVASQTIMALSDSNIGTNTGPCFVLATVSSGATVFSSGGGTNAQASFQLAPSTLYHIVGSTNTTNNSIYVNGSLAATTAGGAVNPRTTPFLVLGSQHSFGGGGTGTFGGKFIMANYANVQWSASEVWARYTDPTSFLSFPEDDIFADLVGRTAVAAAKTPQLWQRIVE